MVGAMCTSFFTKNQHQLCGQTKPSDWHLHMVNGTIVQSEAVWNGVLELGGIQEEAEFKIFDSRGSWEFLFRKPLLHHFRALHDFTTDTVTIQSACESVILHNTAGGNTPTAQIGISLTLDVEQQEISAGGSLGVNPPPRQVSHTDVSEPLVQNNELDSFLGYEHTQDKEELMKLDGNSESWKSQDEEQGMNQGGGSTPPLREVPNQSPPSEDIKETDDIHATASEVVVDIERNPAPAKSVHAHQVELLWIEREDTSEGNEQPPSRGVQTQTTGLQVSNPADVPCLVLPVASTTDTPSEDLLYTHHTEPFQPACVAKILNLVQIGDDVTAGQHEEIRQLIAEFADCFALSLTEVNLIPGTVHKLNIPADTTFHTKLPQCSFNPDQQAFMEVKVEEMLKASIICSIHPGDLKCSAPSVLTQKAHENTGLSLGELKHKVNDECIKHDLPAAFDLPPHPTPTTNATSFTSPKKWHLCQDFGEINKVTPIAPVPQGDIHAKQLQLSGHQYVHIFDFAAGFYSIAIHPNSQPYITFHLEGRGHFAYERMPFGITGGPSEFGHTVGQHMHNLIADGTCKNFVDDGGSAADSFKEGMAKLRRILEHVHRERLSLSPGKLQVFMTEAVFVGAHVGPGGVSPDSSKLTAVVDWKIPEDASHLEGFLGLTAYFRDLVKGYATLEKPL